MLHASTQPDYRFTVLSPRFVPGSILGIRYWPISDWVNILGHDKLLPSFTSTASAKFAFLHVAIIFLQSFSFIYQRAHYHNFKSEDTIYTVGLLHMPTIVMAPRFLIVWHWILICLTHNAQLQYKLSIFSPKIFLSSSEYQTWFCMFLVTGFSRLGTQSQLLCECTQKFFIAKPWAKADWDSCWLLLMMGLKNVTRHFIIWFVRTQSNGPISGGMLVSLTLGIINKPYSTFTALGEEVWAGATPFGTVSQCGWYG